MDNQEYLRKTSYYDEFTGKQNKNSTERLEQQVNIELLRGLSKELKEKAQQIKENIETRKKQEEQLEKNIKNIQTRKKHLEEISSLSKQLPINYQLSITKLLATKGLIEVSNPSIELIPDLRQLTAANATEWKTLKKKLENTELIISSNLIDKSQIEVLKK